MQQVQRPVQILIVPYALLRLPLSVLDNRLFRPMSLQSRRRRVFDVGLGVLDHWAERLLGDEAISRNGRCRLTGTCIRHHDNIHNGRAAARDPAAAEDKAYARTRRRPPCPPPGSAVPALLTAEAHSRGRLKDRDGAR